MNTLVSVYKAQGKPKQHDISRQNFMEYHNSRFCFSLQCLCLCVILGFDNNGGTIGPRSTRQSNPEEHASQYFNMFSKDMLVQVSPV